MTTIFYIILAVLPSIIWLLFYLRKDKHPEPNGMIMRIFFLGFLATFIALALELLYQKTLEAFSLQSIVLLTIGGMAFIEEFLKYLVIKIKVLKSSEFDEPVDAIFYMIVAALGFAAAENIFLINGLYIIGLSANEIIQITLERFLGAVLLHALASGIVGYFLARSFLLKRGRKSFIYLGIFISTCLHGIYNYIIIEVGPYSENFIIFLVILISIMAVAVSLAFKNLKKFKSVCKIET